MRCGTGDDNAALRDEYKEDQKAEWMMIPKAIYGRYLTNGIAHALYPRRRSSYMDAKTLLYAGQEFCTLAAMRLMEVDQMGSCSATEIDWAMNEMKTMG